jgi:hypothetical protein
MRRKSTTPTTTLEALPGTALMCEVRTFCVPDRLPVKVYTMGSHSLSVSTSSDGTTLSLNSAVMPESGCVTHVFRTGDGLALRLRSDIDGTFDRAELGIPRFWNRCNGSPCGFTTPSGLELDMCDVWVSPNQCSDPDSPIGDDREGQSEIKLFAPSDSWVALRDIDRKDDNEDLKLHLLFQHRGRDRYDRAAPYKVQIEDEAHSHDSSQSFRCEMFNVPSFESRESVQDEWFIQAARTSSTNDESADILAHLSVRIDSAWERILGLLVECSMIEGDQEFKRKSADPDPIPHVELKRKWDDDEEHSRKAKSKPKEKVRVTKRRNCAD